MRQSHPQVANIPLLESATLEKARADIEQSPKTKILVLPALYREFEDNPELGRSAMDGILPQLQEAGYIDHVIIGLDGADEQQYQEVLQLIEDMDLPQNVHVLWNDSPEMSKWRDELGSMFHEGQALAPTAKGKGRNVWGCAGYALGLLEKEGINTEDAIFAMHDADIVTYDEMLMARLFQPMCLEEGENIDHVKGYYTRYDHQKLNGRVTRLFGPAFIDSLANTMQPHPDYNEKARDLMSFIRAFNYTFSGEMAFRGDLLEELELPNDYSLEIRLLEQTHRLGKERGTFTADVQLAQRYDHHHQGIDGLEKMAAQIAAAMMDIINDRIPVTEEHVDRVTAGYARRAKPLTGHFDLASAMSGLNYDKPKEEGSVVAFTNAPRQGYEMMKQGLATCSMSWGAVRRLQPQALQNLVEIVDGKGGVFEKTSSSDAPAKSIEHSYAAQ